MPLLDHEIRPGTVAILDAAPLNESSEITYANDKHEFRSGPFLCVQANAERSAWVNLTTQQDRRGLRLEIKPEWRLEGSDIWRNKPQFVHDARKAFVGPNRVFFLQVQKNYLIDLTIGHASLPKALRPCLLK